MGHYESVIRHRSFEHNPRLNLYRSRTANDCFVSFAKAFCTSELSGFSDAVIASEFTHYLPIL
jgi:hypothetical protein